MGYAAVKCFLVEPTDTVKLFARCFVSSSDPDGGKCEASGMGYHNAEVFYKDIESPLTKEGYDTSEPAQLPEDAPFPTHCACGFEFRAKDRTIFTSRIYKRSDNGETLTFQDVHKAPGAMYRATWCEDYKPWCGPDGRSYIVVLPNGREWQIDGRASNCTMKDDNIHKCWVRHGEAPNFTVDKNGPTCAAGGGSILAGDYHGFLQNGWLTAG